MSAHRARYIVGIDLGTTHTVVAYAEGSEAPRIFRVPQLVTPTEVSELPLLASALYAPAAGESLADPWNEAPFAVGEFARARGGAVPGRGVLSAKSWLSHLGVDRDAPILPWGAKTTRPSRAYRRWMPARRTCGTCKELGIKPFPSTRSKRKTWCLRCRRRSTRRPASSPSKPRAAQGSR